MVERNVNFKKLNSGYLFPEIRKKAQAFLEKNPKAQLISLGIGDTTEPLPPAIIEGLHAQVARLGTKEGYTGYGPEQGCLELRQLIADKIYHGRVKDNEVFVTDGAKCDLGRLQLLFGNKATIAVQDPSYPAYVDGSVIFGRSGEFNTSFFQYQGLSYLPCHPKNDFFPDLTKTNPSDLIFFSSPNNPTGVAANRKQLSELVQFAKNNSSIIIFDSAYSSYIRNPEIPKSIFELEESRDCAIEVGSFSKMAGFTGVRLGWTVVPEQLKYNDGSSIRDDWLRLLQTCYNGASNIAQSGAIAALSSEGLKQMQQLQNYYSKNAQLLKIAFEKLGAIVYGGIDAPFLWVMFEKKNSWDLFHTMLERYHIITTPGSGFGKQGEGFLRISAFGQRQDVEEVVRRLAK